MESMIAPGFLVASPQLQDPNFERTVVLMLEHRDEEGSLGLVINRPAGVELELVLGEMKIPFREEAIDDAPRILYGGPVSPERGWVLHSDDWRGDETHFVAEGLAVTSTPDVLEAIGEGVGPTRHCFCLGYAGWGPGQLVEEIKTGAWINVPFDIELVLGEPLEERWAAALRRLGIDPGQLASVVGDA